MIDTYSVPLKTLVEEFHLEIAYAASDYASIRITVEDVSRPGLQLAGFFDHYEPMRLQVMGNVEMSYVGKLTPANRSAIFDRLFSYKFPALLIARGIQPHPEMLEMAKLGAGVMQPRAVEMGSRFGVPIHVRSTFSEDEGTMIQEDCSMEVKQYLIRGVASDKNVAKITVLGIPNKPGFAYRVFAELAEKHVDVDMIVQSVRIANEGVTDITFTIARTDLEQAKAVLANLRKEMPVEDVLIDDKMAKVSVVGAGMFGVLGDNGINIEIISTSEISITCLISEDVIDKAVKAIHAHFFDED